MAECTGFVCGDGSPVRNQGAGGADGLVRKVLVVSGATPAGEEAKEVDVENDDKQETDLPRTILSFGPTLNFDTISGFYVPSRKIIDEASLPLHTLLMHL